VLPEYDVLSHPDPLTVAVPAVCDKLPPLPNENPSVRFVVTDIDPLMLTVIPAEAVELLQVVRVPVVDVPVVLAVSLYVFVSVGIFCQSVWLSVNVGGVGIECPRHVPRRRHAGRPRCRPVVAPAGGAWVIVACLTFLSGSCLTFVHYCGR
jgi:hypothetical protein